MEYSYFFILNIFLPHEKIKKISKLITIKPYSHCIYCKISAKQVAFNRRFHHFWSSSWSYIIFCSCCSKIYFKAIIHCNNSCFKFLMNKYFATIFFSIGSCKLCAVPFYNYIYIKIFLIH